ncbi:hypothetical protein AX16_002262 [Volvariella volvacea WC 439]|uniref:Putative 2-oxoglutarate dependent oxygenase n=1 Tax=Volvariella volvacea TaxID=36659 RepID=A0A0N9H469_9AGAR|nr:putative 2-oxoglutarate dependent oxygenase [Volvariella volvacea]KAF8657148.1 hypothetical protein AX16_002262 [Volvariella volvacea WC 439]
MKRDPTVESQIESIRAALTVSPPYCSGTATLDDLGGHLFYLCPGQGDESNFINLAKAKESQLQALTDACQLATFGLNNQDVYDESYRKARKMDTTHFVTRFDPVECGIMNFVKEQLLDPADHDKEIRGELYKLNVYDKGSFFKPHVDTPRGNDMFGSLVVVFPTPHQGGSLFLRHQGKEWRVDSNQLLSKTSEPCVVFIAFYSDIEHEVQVVSSGYRVTLTYNLYHGASQPRYSMTKAIDIRIPDEEQLYSLISTLMEDRTKVLPNGGYLGFGLQHKYPVPYDRNLSNVLLRRLKGVDEILRTICRRLSYSTSIQLIAENDEIMLPYAPELSTDEEITEDWVDYLSHCQVVVPVAGKENISNWRDDSDGGKELVWVVPPAGVTYIKEDYLHYGNEASVLTFYGEVCLIAKVPPPFRTDSEEECDNTSNESEGSEDEEE